ncbi:unnamed protein product [Vitrella brassicaformis CCMP3155]|uniref:Uncharacterized protein n=3 Tax=Vitrella brassicaformis TaxID=1169539 RepID=A0A0G4G532_VITBC|nr:unnamed protein product [Vitrella brassicaformis CCMP3155]|eukprot:CEM23528.1 unnamed protein product [Vitrella brassicaformis CCMP3155]
MRSATIMGSERRNALIGLAVLSSHIFAVAFRVPLQRHRLCSLARPRALGLPRAISQDQDLGLSRVSQPPLPPGGESHDASYSSTPPFLPVAAAVNRTIGYDADDEDYEIVYTRESAGEPLSVDDVVLVDVLDQKMEPLELLSGRELRQARQDAGLKRHRPVLQGMLKRRKSLRSLFASSPRRFVVRLLKGRLPPPDHLAERSYSLMADADDPALLRCVLSLQEALQRHGYAVYPLRLEHAIITPNEKGRIREWWSRCVSSRRGQGGKAESESRYGCRIAIPCQVYRSADPPLRLVHEAIPRASNTGPPAAPRAFRTKADSLTNVIGLQPGKPFRVVRGRWRSIDKSGIFEPLSNTSLAAVALNQTGSPVPNIQLLLRAAERPSRSIEPGISFTVDNLKDDWLGEVSFKDRNFLGRGKEVGVDIRRSPRLLKQRPSQEEDRSGTGDESEGTGGQAAGGGPSIFSVNLRFLDNVFSFADGRGFKGNAYVQLDGSVAESSGDKKSQEQASALIGGNLEWLTGPKRWGQTVLGLELQQRRRICESGGIQAPKPCASQPHSSDFVAMLREKFGSRMTTEAKTSLTYLTPLKELAAALQTTGQAKLSTAVGLHDYSPPLGQTSCQVDHDRPLRSFLRLDLTSTETLRLGALLPPRQASSSRPPPPPPPPASNNSSWPVVLRMGMDLSKTMGVFRQQVGGIVGVDLPAAGEPSDEQLCTDTQSWPCVTPGPLPPWERFYLGGIGSVRGHGYHALGPFHASGRAVAEVRVPTTIDVKVNRPHVTFHRDAIRFVRRRMGRRDDADDGGGAATPAGTREKGGNPLFAKKLSLDVFAHADAGVGVDWRDGSAVSDTSVTDLLDAIRPGHDSGTTSAAKGKRAMTGVGVGVGLRCRGVMLCASVKLPVAASGGRSGADEGSVSMSVEPGGLIRPARSGVGGGGGKERRSVFGSLKFHVGMSQQDGLEPL